MEPGEMPSADLQSGGKITRAEAESAQLFRDTDLDVIWPLVERCPIRELPRGEVLIAEGELSRNVYVLLKGMLEVQLDPARKDVVARIDPGQTVGELAPIDHRARSATVIAATECRVLDVAEDTFWSLLRTSHAFALNVLGTVCDRLRGINVSLTESRRLQKELERKANIDVLTNLGNRRWLDEVLQFEVRGASGGGAPLSVVMIDIDHFKLLNDAHGHSAGDYVLASVARSLKAQFRPNDRVARYGGEEFTVVLPATALADAVKAANRVRRAIADTPLVAPGSLEAIPVTISLGVAEYRPGDTVEILVTRADQALYRAKHEGRNRVCSSPPA
jgi:diguanylate cyclase (GGDEF)-like protein